LYITEKKAAYHVLKANSKLSNMQAFQKRKDMNHFFLGASQNNSRDKGCMEWGSLLSKKNQDKT
jgi:hypothetical protein